MRTETEKMQLRALYRWEFEITESGDWHFQFANLEIMWNVKHQQGAYIIDGQLSLLYDWDHLDDLMSQTAMY